MKHPCLSYARASSNSPLFLLFFDDWGVGGIEPLTLRLSYMLNATKAIVILAMISLFSYIFLQQSFCFRLIYYTGSWLQAIVSFITMQLQLCSVFFTFSLGTKTHYFGRTILHGGAKVCLLCYIFCSKRPYSILKTLLLYSIMQLEGDLWFAISNSLKITDCTPAAILLKGLCHSFPFHMRVFMSYLNSADYVNYSFFKLWAVLSAPSLFYICV